MPDDKQPREHTARQAKALAWSVAIIQLGLGVLVYLDVKYQTLAIILACVSVVAFALIDGFVRPRVGAEAAKVRKYLAFWSVVPFLCALGASVWLHYQQWHDAMDGIGIVADDMGQQLCKSSCNWSTITPDDIEKKIEEVMKSRFPGDDAKTDEAHQYDEIIRVVATDVVQAKGDRAHVVRRARRDTLPGFLLALSIQSLFVLWVPLLLAIKIFKANRSLGEVSIDPTTGPRDYKQSVYARDRRILGEDHAFFLPRFCFGAMLVLGTNYVLAPFGLKASYMMDLVDVHALPGHTSYTLWSTSFSSAPVIVVGFVGFLIYAVITASQRFLQDDLDDSALLSLLVRGLVVILLSFALSSSPLSETGSRLFVFVAGVFPVRALEALGKRVSIAADPEFQSDDDKETRSFSGLPSLDPTKVFALRAAGIQSAYDLAATKIEDISARVRIDPRLLGRTVDRAILIEAVGKELADKLAPFAITTATELVKLRQAGMPDAVKKAFGDTDVAVDRLAERLANDPRVAKVQKWLDDSRGD